MFGFARSRPSMLSSKDCVHLKRFYCGLCDALRRDYGLPFSALTGWDGRFIALLTGAQAAQDHEEPSFTWTRCPAMLGVRSRTMTPYGISTRYAAAVTVFLLGEKLDDDVRDEHSSRAKVGNLLTRRQITHAAGVLRELGFPLSEAISIRKEQQAVEASRRRYSLDEVTEPTAQATALILGYTAVLAGKSQNIQALHAMGRAVGRIVTLLDACQDFTKDMASHGSNAIAAAFADGLVGSIPAEHYKLTEDYLHLQLRDIRQAYPILDLRRHGTIVQNILFMGLYDAMTEATQELALCVTDLAPQQKQEWNCPFCGVLIYSRFCPSCGKGPQKMFEAMEAL